ncbi:MAG: hypothetical protein R3A80_07145 [Bdellovibrionota bacterium]
MEVNCPSCGSTHRSEDYPGAFDILCGCGYLILNPDLGASTPADDYNEINFEGPPVVDETSAKDLIKVEDPNEEFLNIEVPAALEPEESNFSAENLTPSEDLPDGMLYDPAEVPVSNTEEITPKAESTLSRIFVERVQRASIGQILGPDYDLEFTNLEAEARLQARERIEKFLSDHKWLKEEMERRSFVLKDAFQVEKLYQIPEALAVEMYIACLENGGACLFIRHQQQLSA